MKKPEIKKTYQLVIRPDEDSHKIGEYFENKLNNNGWEKSDKPSIVIAIGGDGTMLYAFHQYYNPKTSFVGLHTGTLGFYADWNVNEKDILLEHIFNTVPQIIQYPLVEATFYYTDRKKTDKVFALNELIIKSQTLSTFKMDIKINDNHFESFRGDGIIISTPSGSTAYNYSVNGAVVHPSFEAIQIAELASLNNAEYRTLNSSFILPKHHLLSLKVLNEEKDVLVGIDAFKKEYKNVDYITAKVSKNKINFLRYKPLPFWQRVKEKFIN